MLCYENKPRMRICFDPEHEIPKLQSWFAENNHPSRLQVRAANDPSVLEPETGRGFYVYSSCLCLFVTALSFTTTAGSDKLKEFARVGVFSTVITKFN